MPEPLLWMNTNPMNRKKYFLAHKKYAALQKKGRALPQKPLLTIFHDVFTGMLGLTRKQCLTNEI